MPPWPNRKDWVLAKEAGTCLPGNSTLPDIILGSGLTVPEI
jgi:hypothetical protein